MVSWLDEKNTGKNAVTIRLRVAQQGETLMARPNLNLFDCSVCPLGHNEVQARAFSVERHLSSGQHQVKVQERANASSFFVQFRSKEEDMGRDFNKQVCLAILDAGISFNCLRRPLLRALLEERHRYRLLSPPSLAKFIPEVLSDLNAQLVDMSYGMPSTLIFDGATAVGELLAVRLRLVNSRLVVRQPVLAVLQKTKKLNAIDLASTVYDVVSLMNVSRRMSAASPRYAGADPSARDFAYSSTSAIANVTSGAFTVVGLMADNESTNDAACADLVGKFSSATRMHCFSHLLNLVGSRVQEHLAEPVKVLLACWATIIRNEAACLCFVANKQALGLNSKTKPRQTCDTRWYTWYEQAAEIYAMWDAVLAMLGDLVRAKPAICLAAAEQALELMTAPSTRLIVRCVLAALVDMYKPVVEGCYTLEGDDILSPVASAVLDRITATFKSCMTDPETGFVRVCTTGTLRELEGATAVERAAVQASLKSTFTEAYKYYNGKFISEGVGTVALNVNLFDALRLLDPRFAARHPPVDGVVGVDVVKRLDHLLQHAAFAWLGREAVGAMPGLMFPANRDQLRRKLLHEYSAYAAEAAANVLGPSDDAGLGRWWRSTVRDDRDHPFGSWVPLVQRAGLVLTSSASVERIFSIYRLIINKRRASSLIDLVDATLKTRMRHELDWRQQPDMRLRRRGAAGVDQDGSDAEDDEGDEAGDGRDDD